MTVQYTHAKSRKAISVMSSRPCNILTFPVTNISQVSFLILSEADTFRDLNIRA